MKQSFQVGDIVTVEQLYKAGKLFEIYIPIAMARQFIYKMELSKKEGKVCFTYSNGNSDGHCESYPLNHTFEVTSSYDDRLCVK